jgi:hypothetical protein
LGAVGRLSNSNGGVTVIDPEQSAFHKLFNLVFKTPVGDNESGL